MVVYASDGHLMANLSTVKSQLLCLFGSKAYSP
jgi:hypothetical protein